MPDITYTVAGPGKPPKLGEPEPPDLPVEPPTRVDDTEIQLERYLAAERRPTERTKPPTKSAPPRKNKPPKLDGGPPPAVTPMRAGKAGAKKMLRVRRNRKITTAHVGRLAGVVKARTKRSKKRGG